VLNVREVAKYSNFVPIEGYISETVQDRRWVSISYYYEPQNRQFQ